MIANVAHPYPNPRSNIYFLFFCFVYFTFFNLLCIFLTLVQKWPLVQNILRSILFPRACLCPRASLASCNFVLMEFSPLVQFVFMQFRPVPLPNIRDAMVYKERLLIYGIRVKYFRTLAFNVESIQKHSWWYMLVLFVYPVYQKQF